MNLGDSNIDIRIKIIQDSKQKVILIRHSTLDGDLMTHFVSKEHYPANVVHT